MSTPAPAWKQWRTDDSSLSAGLRWDTSPACAETLLSIKYRGRAWSVWCQKKLGLIWERGNDFSRLKKKKLVAFLSIIGLLCTTPATHHFVHNTCKNAFHIRWPLYILYLVLLTGISKIYTLAWCCTMICYLQYWEQLQVWTSVSELTSIKHLTYNEWEICCCMKGFAN